MILIILLCSFHHFPHYLCTQFLTCVLFFVQRLYSLFRISRIRTYDQQRVLIHEGWEKIIFVHRYGRKALMSYNFTHNSAANTASAKTGNQDIPDYGFASVDIAFSPIRIAFCNCFGKFCIRSFIIVSVFCEGSKR